MDKDTCLYLFCRILRRFLPWTLLPKKLKEKIPGFKPNLGEVNQEGIFSIYQNNIPLPFDQWLPGKAILEIGTGRTNGGCYVLVAHGASKAVSFEPFRPLDKERDELQLREVAATRQLKEDDLRKRVLRVTSVDPLPDESFDMVLSLAVLEHVTNMPVFTNDLWRLLKPGGVMFHAVDYRDHFFRYPYHHLLWSAKTWSRFLDPGDLPRWRIGDHVNFFMQKGFDTRIVKSSSLDPEFCRIKDRIHSEFTSRYDDRNLKTAYGMIWAQKPTG